MKKHTCLSVIILLSTILNAQGPEVTSWIVNVTGATNPSYTFYESNVQSVDYNSTDVYVSCTCIPGYDIGPWTANPNTPSNQNFCFRINRNPQENTGTKTETPMGHVGVWTNGVSIFNAKDGMSYNNGNVWYQDALYFEGISFDDCLGHPAQNGEYHHHVNPTCLYDDDDDQNHSPIIGYAFDHFPIYGAYGYTNTNGTGAIKRMESSYQQRNITTRTTLPDGTALSAGQHGPVVSSQYPLGAFIQDYEFIAGSGDLDEFNGRYCVTPEYPLGTYAYFVAIDNSLEPIYPYVIGPEYYGIAQGYDNLGPQSGHNTIPGGTTSYVPSTTFILENQQTLEKDLVKVVDVLGREVVPVSNIPLFYIYSDGSVQRKMIIE